MSTYRQHGLSLCQGLFLLVHQVEVGLDEVDVPTWRARPARFQALVYLDKALRGYSLKLFFRYFG